MTEKERQLAEVRGGKWVGKGAQSYDRKIAWVLYKSFNTLWVMI